MENITNPKNQINEQKNGLYAIQKTNCEIFLSIKEKYASIVEISATIVQIDIK